MGFNSGFKGLRKNAEFLNVRHGKTFKLSVGFEGLEFNNSLKPTSQECDQCENQ